MVSAYCTALQVPSILILDLKQTKLRQWASWIDHGLLFQPLSKLNISRTRILVWEHEPHETPLGRTFSVSHWNLGSILVRAGGKRPCDVRHLGPLQLVVSHEEKPSETRVGWHRAGEVFSVEWWRSHWHTFKVRVLNVGRSTLRVNVQSRFNGSRFRCDTEGQHHTLQEQTTFREIWIPISHAKHCKRKGYNYCIVGKWPKKEGTYPKRETAADRLQSLLIDYKRPQKVGHGLQSLLMDYKSPT